MDMSLRKVDGRLYELIVDTGAFIHQRLCHIASVVTKLWPYHDPEPDTVVAAR